MNPVIQMEKLNTYPNLLTQLALAIPEWQNYSSIGLNTLPGSDNHQTGSGSLYYDWDRTETVLDADNTPKIHVPLRDTPLREHDFTELCSVFRGTDFEILYKELKRHYQIGRVRIMTSKPKTCLSWHVDDTPRLHYPIKTQEGCLMVIGDTVTHLQQEKWYWTNTLIPHTAFNASKELRIHLVVCILGEHDA